MRSDIRSLNAKLGKMKKIVDWVVYPLEAGCEDSKIRKIQSDHYFAIVKMDQGKAILSKRVANYPNSNHCLIVVDGKMLRAPGATVVDASEVIEQIKAMEANSGVQAGPIRIM